MKKFAIFSVTAMMFASAATVQCADDVTVMLDGEQLTFDVPPQIIKERTFVPLRVIFETMGAEVVWDGDARKVTAVKSDTTVEMIIDNVVMTVNGEEITLDVPPQIVEDRTLVPARAVAESFGAMVDWDGDTRTVLITSEPEPVPTAVPEPAPTEPPTETGDFNIEYDRSKGRSYVSLFKLTSVKKIDNGKYEIECYFETFKEGSGSISVFFNCLDESGAVVDTFGGNFVGIDYTWSPQTYKTEISDKTVKIEVKE